VLRVSEIGPGAHGRRDLTEYAVMRRHTHRLSMSSPVFGVSIPNDQYLLAVSYIQTSHTPDIVRTTPSTTRIQAVGRYRIPTVAPSNVPLRVTAA
jgi:hypothetical protein